MWNLRCTRTKQHTRTRPRPAPELSVDGRGSTLLPEIHSLKLALFHMRSGGTTTIKVQTSGQEKPTCADLFFTLGCVREGGEGGSWQQGAERKERTEDVFCPAPSSSPALVHLLCNLKLPVSNIIYGNAQAESQNQKPNSASLIPFSTQAVTLLALFLKKRIPTWLLQPVCARICVSTLKTSLSSFLRTLPCNSAVSIRFNRKTQGSKLFSSQTFDWTICPRRETRARGASVRDGNAELSLCSVWKWPSDPCPHAHWLASWHVGTISVAQKSWGHWSMLERVSILQWWEACGMWGEQKAWGRAACSWRHKEELGWFNKRHRGYGVQIWGEALPAPAEQLSYSMAPGLSTTWHISSSSVRQVAIPPEQNWAHFVTFCVFHGLDNALEINQMMHKFTDHSSRRFRKQGFC